MMRDSKIQRMEGDGYTKLLWQLNTYVRLNAPQISKENKYRVIAWQSLSQEEKEQVAHPWKKADVQHMENEEGPVDTVAVMFETLQNGQDGFIVVYIDLHSFKVTGTESFY